MCNIIMPQQQTKSDNLNLPALLACCLLPKTRRTHTKRTNQTKLKTRRSIIIDHGRKPQSAPAPPPPPAGRATPVPPPSLDPTHLQLRRSGRRCRPQGRSARRGRHWRRRNGRDRHFFHVGSPTHCTACNKRSFPGLVFLGFCPPKEGRRGQAGGCGPRIPKRAGVGACLGSNAALLLLCVAVGSGCGKRRLGSTAPAPAPEAPAGAASLARRAGSCEGGRRQQRQESASQLQPLLWEKAKLHLATSRQQPRVTLEPARDFFYCTCRGSRFVCNTGNVCSNATAVQRKICGAAGTLLERACLLCVAESDERTYM